MGPQLFLLFDVNQDGQLCLSEFQAMVNSMEIGMTEDRLVRLFETLDSDGSEAIDDREPVKALFPKAYHDLYGPETEDDAGSENGDGSTNRGSGRENGSRESGSKSVKKNLSADATELTVQSSFNDTISVTTELSTHSV